MLNWYTKWSLRFLKHFELKNSQSNWPIKFSLRRKKYFYWKNPMLR